MKTTLSKLSIGGAMLFAVSGCASSSDEIAAAYVSPLTYERYSCDQVRIEMDRLRSRVSSLGGQLDEKASTDDWQMGVGLVLFWPTLFFLDGDGTEAAEFSRIKGEYEALQQAATMKNCMGASTTAEMEEGEESDAEMKSDADMDADVMAETEEEMKARLRAEVKAEMEAEMKMKAEVKAEMESASQSEAAAADTVSDMSDEPSEEMATEAAADVMDDLEPTQDEEMTGSE